MKITTARDFAVVLLSKRKPPAMQVVPKSFGIQALLEISSIHDIIPVGSRGIRLEAELIASTINTRLDVDSACPLDLDKSAGPSSCLIFSSSSLLSQSSQSSLTPLSFPTFLSSTSSSTFDHLLSSKFPLLPLTRIGHLY